MKTKEEIHKLIENMTDAQKAGQLFLLAYPGEDPSAIAPLFEKYGLCGCYISQDNAETFEKASEISEELQRLSAVSSAIPLILGVDQEGSWGVLIPSSTPGPGNMALCASNDLEATQNIYRICGTEMLSVGYNAILGPCSDVNTDPASPIITVRSFGEYPQRVAHHVVKAVQGLRQAGSLSCLKHFPGHGATSGDTHREIPTVDKSLDKLMKEDLVPFKAGIKAGCDMVMTSHILYPAIDAVSPATLSSNILQGVLRDTLHFDGVIISDSMNMGAIRKTYDPAVSTLLALQAGVDVVMLSEEHYDFNQDKYLEKQLQSLSLVEKAISEGTLSKRLVDEKLYRILHMKFNRMELKTQRLSDEQIKSNKERALSVSQNAIQVLQKGSVKDIRLKRGAVCINATNRGSYVKMMNDRGIGPNQKTPAFDSFKETLSPFSDILFLEQDKGFEEIGKPLLENTSRIYVVTEDYPLPGEDFDKNGQLELLEKLSDCYKDKLVIIGLRSSYELNNYSQDVTYVCSYSSRTCSAIAMALYIAGDYDLSAKAIPPVSLRF